jgi:hypothetical protein
MLQRETLENRVRSCHGGQNVRIVRIPPLRYEITKAFDICDRAVTIHVQEKFAGGLDLIKRCELIKVQGHRCEGRHFTPQGGLTAMPTIDWPGIEHQLFSARRLNNPGEGSAMNTFTAISTDKHYDT